MERLLETKTTINTILSRKTPNSKSKEMQTRGSVWLARCHHVKVVNLVLQKLLGNITQDSSAHSGYSCRAERNAGKPCTKQSAFPVPVCRGKVTCSPLSRSYNQGCLLRNKNPEKTINQPLTLYFTSLWCRVSEVVSTDTKAHVAGHRIRRPSAQRL